MAKMDRFKMSAEDYLSNYHVMVYLEDALANLLSLREKNSQLHPFKFLSQYFCTVRQGNHIMHRDYAFVRRTPHNRASFIRLFWKCFRRVGQKADLLSIKEYHSLLTLLCSDFPFDLVQKSARIVLIDDAMDCLISFSDFIYAFQIQFYFEEYLDKCLEAYERLTMQSSTSSRCPVIVPTSVAESPSTDVTHSSSHSPVEGVDSKTFCRAIMPFCDLLPQRMLATEGETVGFNEHWDRFVRQQSAHYRLTNNADLLSSSS